MIQACEHGNKASTADRGTYGQAEHQGKEGWKMLIHRFREALCRLFGTSKQPAVRAVTPPLSSVEVAAPVGAPEQQVGTVRQKAPDLLVLDASPDKWRTNSSGAKNCVS